MDLSCLQQFISKTLPEKTSTNDDRPNRAEEWRGHPSARENSAASSPPLSRQTTIAHPGRSRRAATLSPGLVLGKKSSADLTGLQDIPLRLRTALRHHSLEVAKRPSLIRGIVVVPPPSLRDSFGESGKKEIGYRCHGGAGELKGKGETKSNTDDGHRGALMVPLHSEQQLS
ncbi:hypothetical protein CEXT_174521 [Caerostris extrusa]|uniref:Uncharacterized protein n=1 Tax=Caerostris extrusa TaxID=172846 RepID=A0AAV4XEJ1_CAEEX|nr:hypothetical protein CEXT_174521 [Caerostris extrusa]